MLQKDGGRMSLIREMEITSPLEANGAIPVNIQDQHSRAIDLYFKKVVNAGTTLSVIAAAEATTITVASTTGFTAGVMVGLFNSVTGWYYFGTQIGAVAGSVVTLDTPVDRAFAIGDTAIPFTKNMNVDGSSTTQVFQIGPVGATSEVDVTRLLGYIQDGSSMDDAMFGGITALTNGLVLRRNDDTITNYWNVKSNGDFRLIAYDTAYSDKAPAGSYSIGWRSTYGSPGKHGVTIRLEAGDTLELLIQDDLTDLEVFHIMAQGHLVAD